MNEDNEAEAIVAKATLPEEPLPEATAPEAMMAEGYVTAPAVAAAVDEPGPEIVEAVLPEVPASDEATAANHPYAGFHEIYGDDSDIEIVDAPIDGPPVPTELEINRRRLYEAKLEPFRAANRGIEIQAQMAAADIEIVDVVLSDEEPASSPNLPAMDKPAPPAIETAMTAAEAGPSEKPASLGQALLASGVVPNPSASRTDPLAPVRRMSQAEKIALFT
jgi:hypothetical protein